MEEEGYNGFDGLEVKQRPNPILNDVFFLNLGSKQTATRFHTGCLHDVLVLIGCLQDPLFYYKKQAKSLGSGLKGGMELGKGG